MDLLEDRLRNVLSEQATQTPPLPAATALVARAQRRTRRTRALAVASAGLTVAVVAMAATVVATRDSSQTHRPIPIHPAPTRPTSFVATASIDDAQGISTGLKLQ